MIVKVGTNVLTLDDGVLNLGVMQNIALQIKVLMNKYQIILISSGSIGCGVQKLGLSERPDTIREKQACASVGQAELMRVWEIVFGKVVVGQILPTNYDFSLRESRENFIQTTNQLWEWGVVPIINENDPMSTAEIGRVVFGDNDGLGALVGWLLDADHYVVLTDVDGVFDKNPKYPDARLIPVINTIDDRIRGYAQGQGTCGRGGMATKLDAMGKVTSHDTDGHILNGFIPNGIIKVLNDGERIGTYFPANSRRK